MKVNQKCVRLSDSVNRYIEQYRGENFSQKLENLVLDSAENYEKMEQEKRLLQNHIDEKLDEMREVQNRLKALRSVEARFNPLINALVDLVDVS